MEEEKHNRIVNRHIARLLTKLSEINIPVIAQDAIKKELWFLSKDIKELYNK